MTLFGSPPLTAQCQASEVLLNSALIIIFGKPQEPTSDRTHPSGGAMSKMVWRPYQHLRGSRADLYGLTLCRRIF